MLDWLRRHWHHNPSNVYIFLFTLICLYLCFPHYWPLWGKFTDCRWIPSQGFSGVEMWCFPVASIIKLVMKQLDDWWFETCGTYVMSLVTMRMKASVAHIYACSVSNNDQCLWRLEGQVTWKKYRCSNMKSYCFHVYNYQRCPQILSEVWGNKGVCI